MGVSFALLAAWLLSDVLLACSANGAGAGLLWLLSPAWLNAWLPLECAA